MGASCLSKPEKTSEAGTLKVSDVRVMRVKSRRNMPQDEIFLQQATSLLLQRQMSKTYSQNNYGSISGRTSFRQDLTRSSSARPRSTVEGLCHSQRLVSKIQDISNLESKKFVLVHGGGFGAWCWYKSIALLEEAGFVTDAIDLSGSGIDATSPNEITTLEQYAKPLISYLENLSDHEKVYLVGHSFGGACISYAMERYSGKIAKAIFVAGTMVENGQSALETFSFEVARNELVFEYANGENSQPTSIHLDKNRVKEILFNRASSKDMALAVVCIRPMPFAPVMEKLLLTQENYGSVRRFYIQTMDDQTLSSASQERMIEMNPPESVLKLKGSDHCPFFSKPQSLHALFLEIVQMEPKKCNVLGDSADGT